MCGENAIVMTQLKNNGSLKILKSRSRKKENIVIISLSHTKRQ
jgi:hypothetical protein